MRQDYFALLPPSTYLCFDSSLHAILWTCSFLAWRNNFGFKGSPTRLPRRLNLRVYFLGTLCPLIYIAVSRIGRRPHEKLNMPSVDVAMARSLRPAAWQLIRDAVARSVAQSLTKRDIVTEAQNQITDAKTAFSSWDNCMKAAFCK